MKLLISFICNLYYYLFFLNGWVLITYLAFKYKLNIYLCIGITISLIVIGLVLLIIEDSYGMNSRNGVSAKIKRYLKIRRKVTDKLSENQI